MSGAVTGALPRALAAQAVHEVRLHGRTLDEALAAREPRCAARDRGLLRALAYGAVRWHLRLAALVERLLARPLRPRDEILTDLLVIGLFQLVAMRMPAPAAVHATVAATALLERPHARGLVNALLRRFQREADTLAAAVDADPARRHACPDWLVRRLAEDWPGHWLALLEAGNAAPPMWLRVNRRHGSREGYLSRLGAEGLQAEPHAEAPDALRLATPVEVERLPGWDAGDVSVQDAAAQLAAGLLDLKPGLRVLDTCAAPGGKTAHLMEREPGLGEVVAVDRSAARVEELSAGLARLKLRPTVICADASRPQDWWDGRPFDRILLDAPCSATGVIRRHPDIKLLRREDDLASLESLQAALLDAAWRMLAPGGRLVYATCSLLRSENEHQVGAFLQRNHGRAELAPGQPISPPGRQIMTGETNMDGFYYACLQHPSSAV